MWGLRLARSLSTDPRSSPVEEAARQRGAELDLHSAHRSSPFSLSRTTREGQLWRQSKLSCYHHRPAKVAADVISTPPCHAHEAASALEWLPLSRGKPRKLAATDDDKRSTPTQTQTQRHRASLLAARSQKAADSRRESVPLCYCHHTDHDQVSTTTNGTTSILLRSTIYTGGIQSQRCTLLPASPRYSVYPASLELGGYPATFLPFAVPSLISSLRWPSQGQMRLDGMAS